MPTFIEQVNNTQDGDLRRRIRMATVIAAVNVQGEAPAAHSPAFLQKRADLAKRVLDSAGAGTATDQVAAAFVWAVCANVAINAQSLDSDIQFAVNAVWSDVAGVTGSDGT
jgi:hypothetical protein